MKLLIHGYNVVRGSIACPEQYDVFDSDNTIVGYIRIRHGRITAECPDVGGDLVYNATTIGDGLFDSSERILHLTKAVNAIQSWIANKSYSDVTNYE